MKLHNIFKSITKRKSNPIKTPLIVADIHEKNSLVLSELHKTTQARLQIKSLKIADYLIGQIAIERKTISDLISSMINKRLIQQLQQMQKYKQSMKIIIFLKQLEDLFYQLSQIIKLQLYLQKIIKTLQNI